VVLTAMKRHLLIILLLVTATGLASHQRTRLARPSTLRIEKLESDAQSTPQKAALKLPLKNPLIVVIKSKRRLELYSDSALVRTYKVGLGLNPIPDKIRQGDHATPEGHYYVFTKNDKTLSTCRSGLAIQILKTQNAGFARK